MTLSTDATSGLSDGIWPPGIPCIPGGSACNPWSSYSPGSSLTSSQPCTPGGRPQHGCVAFAEKDAIDYASAFSHGNDNQLRRKRARLEQGARLQEHGHVEGALRQTVKSPSHYDQMVVTLQPSFSWSQVVPRLSSTYICGSSSSSVDHLGQAAASHCCSEKNTAAFVCTVPSDGPLSSNSAGTLEQAASAPSSWQPPAMFAVCNAPDQLDVMQQFGLATVSSCRASVVRTVVTRQPCDGTSQHSSQQPVIVSSQSVPSSSSLLHGWPVPTGIRSSSGLVLPFIFTAAPVAGPTTATTATTTTAAAVLTAAQLEGLQGHSLSCPLPTAWSGPSVFATVPAQACLQQPVLVPPPPLSEPPQLRHNAQLCIQTVAAPPSFTPLLVGPCNSQPPCTDIGPRPMVRHLPQAQPQPQPQAACPAAPLKSLLAQRPAQSHGRMRPPSPAPPGSPVRHMLPSSSGPEEWILHVIKVLGLTEPDTAPLALHCWRRISGLPQLHHATRHLPSTAAGRNLYATACLWVSIKLEEKRRAAPGGVVLAHMVASQPSVLCSAELAVMNWLAWRPYDGYTPDESHLLVYM